MKISKAILDDKVREHEEGTNHDLTFRQYIQEIEDELHIEHADLDRMTDEALNAYDTFLWELSWK